MSGSSRSTLTVGLVALVLGGAFVGAGVVLGDGRAPATGSADRLPTNTITVSASGSAEAAPDEAIVHVSVEATAEDPTVAREWVAENASTMRAALRGLGINDSAIRTTRFNIYEDQIRPPREGEQPQTRYRASHRYRIVVHDVDTVGGVIDTAIENGATGVGGVEFTLSEATESRLKRRAIDAAAGKARDRARTLATRANVTITDVAWMSTGDVEVPRTEAVAFAAAGDGGGTDVESGPVTVTATVTVAYETAG